MEFYPSQKVNVAIRGRKSLMPSKLSCDVSALLFTERTVTQQILADVLITEFNTNRVENLENTAKNTIYAVRYNISFTASVFTTSMNIERTCAEKYRTKSHQICSKIPKLRVESHLHCNVMCDCHRACYH
jgi:hypothetical protein